MSGRLTIIRGMHPFKDGVFSALAHATGGADWYKFIGMRAKPYPETNERAAYAFSRAKKMPRNPSTQKAKRQMIAAQYNWSRAHFTRHPGSVAVVWNGLGGSRMAYMLGAEDAGNPHLYVELAPFAGHVTLDPEGLNAESSVPRTRGGLGDATLGPVRKARMANDLVARAARGRNKPVGQNRRALPKSPFLFCPLQVPNDTQVQIFGGWADTMPRFARILARQADALPEGWHIRMKEHPSARERITPLLEQLAAASNGRVVIDNQSDTFDQVRASQGVVTMNSSLALQSFLLDRPVIVTGEAFFA
ncbi:MAG: capsular biosynthesis protein, partial [Pseudomonadota bacterium]